MWLLGHVGTPNKIYRKPAKFLRELYQLKCCQLGLKGQTQSKMKEGLWVPNFWAESKLRKVNQLQV